MEIILASESPYRKSQLRSYGLRFKSHRPLIDEEKLKRTNYSPKKLAVFLSREKALSLSDKFFNSAVIGCDQLVSFKGRVLGKPGTRQKAIEQLSLMSGGTHYLITAISVVYKNKIYSDFDVAKIKIRKLTRDEIISYVHRDEPYDCAGSYKFEKSGFSLVEKIHVEDPSSLIGLPLVKMGQLLRKFKEPLPFLP